MCGALRTGAPPAARDKEGQRIWEGVIKSSTRRSSAIRSERPTDGTPGWGETVRPKSRTAMFHAKSMQSLNQNQILNSRSAFVLDRQLSARLLWKESLRDQNSNDGCAPWRQLECRVCLLIEFYMYLIYQKLKG